MGWSVDPSSLNQRDQRTQNVLSLFQNNLACICLTCDETGCDAWCSPACWPPPAAQISFQIRNSNTHIQREQSQSCDIKYSTGWVHVWWYLNASIVYILVLSTSLGFHQSRTKSCDGFLQLWSPYCGWCWQIQDWQKLDILHRAAPDRASLSGKIFRVLLQHFKLCFLLLGVGN